MGQDNSTIRRLHYRSSRDDAMQRRQVLGQIESACQGFDDGVLLIRRLELIAPAFRIGPTLTDLLARSRRQAVSGWDANAASANAVWFADEAELLACLARDTTAGTAPDGWYWRQWATRQQQPLPDDVAQVLQQAPLQLPAVVRHLRRHGLLGPVLTPLTEAQVERLLQAVARQAGWPHLLDRSTRPPPEVVDWPTTIELPDDWRQVLSQATRAPAIARLYALLSVWQQAPQRLQRPDAGGHLQRLTQQLSRQAGQPGIAAPASDREARRAASPPPTAKDIADSQPTTDGPAHGASVSSPAVGPAGAAATGAMAARATTDPPTIAEQPSPIGQPIETAGGDCRTRLGGVFYLLNALNLPAARRLLDEQPASGWHALYRIATHLGPLDDRPLQHWLAGRLQLDSIDQLPQLPPLAAEAVLLRLLDRRYASSDCWDARLLSVTANIHLQDTDLHLIYPASAVRLEVRLAGLDIDPGWLPWLGLRVRFDYRDGGDGP